MYWALSETCNGPLVDVPTCHCPGAPGVADAGANDTAVPELFKI